MNTKEIYIIAEAALSYHGNLELCKLLVDAAHVGQANAIKFQIMYADDICVNPYVHRDLFKKMEMTISDWQVVRNYAHEKNLDFIADVFGEQSFNVSEKINVDSYKIHTTIFNESRLIEKIISTNKKIYLSTGGLQIEEVKNFCNRFYKINPNLTLLYGYQAEPTEIDKNYLNRIPILREITGLDVGFMDHIDAESEYKHSLSHVALGFGVTTFEKHIALCRDFKFENYISSLTPDEFKFYTKSLKDLALAISPSMTDLELTDVELQYRNKAMKKIVARKNISKGQLIDEDLIEFKRTDEDGDAFYSFNELNGKAAKSNISVNQLIKKENTND